MAISDSNILGSTILELQPEPEPPCAADRVFPNWSEDEVFGDTLEINREMWHDWQQYITPEGRIWLWCPVTNDWAFQDECKLYLCPVSHRTWVRELADRQLWFYANLKKTCAGQCYACELSPPFDHDNRGPNWGRRPSN